MYDRLIGVKCDFLVNWILLSMNRTNFSFLTLLISKEELKDVSTLHKVNKKFSVNPDDREDLGNFDEIATILAFIQSDRQQFNGYG